MEDNSDVVCSEHSQSKGHGYSHFFLSNALFCIIRSVTITDSQSFADSLLGSVDIMGPTIINATQNPFIRG